MIARKRLLSVPMQAEITPNRKYDDVTKDPRFLWTATRKFSVKKNEFWGVKKSIRWTPSPAKLRQKSHQKLAPNTSGKDSIRSSNEGDFEYSDNKNNCPTLIKKVLFKSPHVLKESLKSKKSKIPKNSAGSKTVIPAKNNLSSERTFPAAKSPRESVIFLEEVITLSDTDPDSSEEEEPIETSDSDMQNPKNIVHPDFLESSEHKSEFEEYLRLKLKFEGRKKNGTEEETEIIDI